MHNEGVRRAVLVALLLALTAAPADARPAQSEPVAPQPFIAWRQSTPVGVWWAGRLRAGV